MNAISPIYDETTTEFERVIALDQPEYAPLITLRLQGPRFTAAFTRWQFTDEERAIIAAGGELVVSNVVHPLAPFPPIALQIVGAGDPPSLEHLR